MRYLLCVLLVISAPVFAGPKWLEASSDHFVVYSDQKEKDVREFADRLERYHNAMSSGLQLENKKPSPSNRVTVYVVRSEGEVQKLAQDKSKFVAGFYVPRAGGSVAFVPRVDTGSEDASWTEVVLLHEYAHHMMYSVSADSFPMWFSEGFAEFYATAKFEKDGDVGLGLPAVHRGGELSYATDVPIERLLDTEAYLKNKKKGYDAFYGRSWLLFHYLRFSKERKGQSAEYFKRMRAGAIEIDAAISAFGDLKKLDRELDKYQTNTRWSYNLIPASDVKPGPIVITPLSEGASAMMPVRIQSKRGVDPDEAKTLLVTARSVADKYPSDPFVLSALAEAEYDAGNDKEAIAAADKAVATNKNEINAYLQKGYAMARMANDADDQDAAWRDVRREFVKVNKIENDHPIPLIQYYESYREQGKEPTKLAVDGLSWALALSPFDAGLRWSVANEEMTAHKYAEAIVTLGPLAHNPHKSEFTDEALALLTKAQEALEAAKPVLAAAGDTGSEKPLAKAEPKQD
jgi:tetratricopeptide (TPR) repeat protein